MADRQELLIPFDRLLHLADIMDQYRLAIINAKAGIEVSATHVNLKKRILKIMDKNDNRSTVSLKGVRREWVYLRNVIFQYFIGLLKLGLENEDLRYRELYKELGELIGDEADEIEKVLAMIQDNKLGFTS